MNVICTLAETPAMYSTDLNVNVTTLPLPVTESECVECYFERKYYEALLDM